MLFNLCNVGRLTWATSICDILCKYGFAYVWEMQGVEDEHKFLHEFKRCVHDCELQIWNESLCNTSKLRSLRLCNNEMTAEPYLYLYISHRIRSALAKFGISNHDLEIEKGRHKNITTDERLCKLCITNNNYFKEDEFHVLLQCPFYQELRMIYLSIEHLPVNLFTYVNIMSSKDSNELTKLGLFIANMFKLRKHLLSSL